LDLKESYLVEVAEYYAIADDINWTKFILKKGNVLFQSLQRGNISGQVRLDSPKDTEDYITRILPRNGDKHWISILR
jgi:hypothetical protein